MIYGDLENSTIRNILETRLESLHGVSVLEFKHKIIGDHIRIGVLLDVDNLHLCVSSLFELPLRFEKRELLNQIDEIAEAIKTARLQVACERSEPSLHARPLPGTGMRARGRKHI
jgi:hypothetical protein